MLIRSNMRYTMNVSATKQNNIAICDVLVILDMIIYAMRWLVASQELGKYSVSMVATMLIHHKALN